MPAEFRKRLSKQSKNFIVKWIGEDTFSSVPKSKCQILGSNKVDTMLAAQSKQIRMRYYLAVSMIEDDSSTEEEE